MIIFKVNSNIECRLTSLRSSSEQRFSPNMGKFMRVPNYAIYANRNMVASEAELMNKRHEEAFGLIKYVFGIKELFDEQVELTND